MRPFSCQWLALCTICLMLSACAGITYHAEPPKVSIRNIQLVETQALVEYYQMTISLQNSNDFPLFIKGINVQLDINGSEFAHGVSRHAINLLPYAKQQITVNLSADNLGIRSQATALSANNQPVAFRLRGVLSHGLLSVPTSLYNLPFEEQGSLNFSKLLGQRTYSNPMTLRKHH